MHSGTPALSFVHMESIMDAIEMPASAVVAVTKKPKDIERILDRIFGKGCPKTYYSQPVTGNPVSERLISLHQITGSVSMGQGPLTTEQVADHVMRLVTEARYEPQDPPEAGKQRGWEVRSTCVERWPAVYIRAAWV